MGGRSHLLRIVSFYLFQWIFGFAFVDVFAFVNTFAFVDVFFIVNGFAVVDDFAAVDVYDIVDVFAALYGFAIVDVYDAADGFDVVDVVDNVAVVQQLFKAVFLNLLSFADPLWPKKNFAEPFRLQKSSRNTFGYKKIWWVPFGNRKSSLSLYAA